jgi:Ricin-type beta-trefoil lectin domain-like
MKRRLSIMLATIMALLAIDVVVITANAAAAEVGPFQIANYNSGLCIDIAHKSTADDAIIHQWTCGRDSNQVWHFKHQDGCTGPACAFQIIPHNTYNRNPQGCMSNRPLLDGVRLYRCAPPAAFQGFVLVLGSSALPTPGPQFRYRLINQATGLCLSMNGLRRETKATLELCDGSNSQLWIIQA